MAKQVRWTDDGIVEVCVMQDAETILAIYRERGKFGKPLEGIYRQLFNPDLFLRAHGRLYAGAMTRGTSAETVDGMSMENIRKLSDLKVKGRREKPTWLKT